MIPTEDDGADSPAGATFDWSAEGHRRRQARLGLALTPLERLRWLEMMLDAMRRLEGRARSARPLLP